MQYDIIAAGREPNLAKEKVQSDLVELLGFVLKSQKPVTFKRAVLKFSSQFWPQTLKLFTDKIFFSLFFSCSDNSVLQKISSL